MPYLVRPSFLLRRPPGFWQERPPMVLPYRTVHTALAPYLSRCSFFYSGRVRHIAQMKPPRRLGLPSNDVGLWLGWYQCGRIPNGTNLGKFFEARSVHWVIGHNHMSLLHHDNEVYRIPNVLMICQLCRHWWQRRLSLRQPTVPSVTTKTSSWWLTFSAVCYVICESIINSEVRRKDNSVSGQTSPSLWVIVAYQCWFFNSLTIRPCVMSWHRFRDQIN